MSTSVTKRLSRDKSYNKTKQSYQESLSPNEIKEKLEEYKKVSDITSVPLNTHIRYFTINKKTGEKQFRLGGFLTKINTENQYVILSNNTLSWSVQIKNTIFFRKLTFKEFKQEIHEKYKNELDKYKKENKLLKETLREIKNQVKK